MKSKLSVKENMQDLESSFEVTNNNSHQQIPMIIQAY